MPKAKDKGFVDLHSILSKLADGYKIYENDIDDESDNIRDFKSVSESIEQLELIVDDVIEKNTKQPNTSFKNNDLSVNLKNTCVIIL